MDSRRRESAFLPLCMHVSTCCCHLRPLVKRPPDHTFKTVLSLELGALSGAVQVMVLIEVEHSIKQYLLEHSECLAEELGITSADDFDINLADYFDCITGVSAGGWISTYLASRGGQGASRFVLEDPAIVEKYGQIPAGGAEGLRVFFNEYGSTIYPLDTIDPKAGIPLDPTNPLAPGSSSPLFSLDGLEIALEAFLGNTTLADADTTLLIPTVNLETNLVVYFVNNAFKSPAVTSTATLISRMGARSIPLPGEGLIPDIMFDEGKDYFLKDVGAAGGAPVPSTPAKQMKQAGNDTVEFLLVDGGLAIENAGLFGALFVSSESRAYDFDKVAVMSLGAGHQLLNFSDLSNAGNLQWAQGGRTQTFLVYGGLRVFPALMDYLYYADPSRKPFQYLRINGFGPTPPVRQFTNGLGDSRSVPAFEDIGKRAAVEHRELIDIFVRDFIFG